MRRLGLLLLAAFSFSACNLITNNDYTNSQPPSPSIQPKVTPNNIMATQNKIAKSAVIKTSLGDITVELFADQAPTTVANFAALTEGSIEWTDPASGQKKVNTSLYKNTIFHRVIKDFMIQGGDPLGTGTGGPGYKFKDEFDPSLQFNEPYYLAMANSGPNTNGSQFFITVVTTQWLTGKHTIFGKVTAGQGIVDKIATTPVDANDKPTTPVVIKEIQVSYR